MRKTKEEWIAERILKMKELTFMNGLDENQIGWIVDMFDSAWDRGYTDGFSSAVERIGQKQNT